jgi:hypothetical protein
MLELETISKNNLNIITSYLTSPGVTAKGSIGNSHLILEASFKAKNQIHYNTISIKAADINIKNFQIAENNPMTLELEDGYSTNAVLPFSQEEIQVYSDLDQVIEETFDNSLFIQSSKKALHRYIEVREGADSTSKTNQNLKIEGGQITFNSISYSLNDGQLNFEESFSAIKNLVDLDNQLNLEKAKEIHDTIYEYFPILNTSTPVVAELAHKLTNIKDILLSRTYSNTPELAEESVTSLSNTFKDQGQLFRDMLAVICLGIAKGKDFPIASAIIHVPLYNDPYSTIVVNRNEPLKIIHTTTQDDLLTAKIAESAAGAYKTEFNIAIFLNDTYRLVHELLGHAGANILYTNGGNPHPKGEEEAYQKAIIDVLLSLYKKIEQTIEELQINDLWTAHNNLLNSPTLALITSSITPEVQNFENFFKKNNIQSEYLIKKAHNKYFPGKLITEVTQEELISMVNQESERLQLSPMELEIAQKMGILVFAYDKESIGREMFATMLELYYEHNNDPIIKDFFAPIEQVIADPIHSIVTNQLIIPHQLECSGTTSAAIFSYCVEEFLI